MGKKNKEAAAKPMAFVLRVPMHCRCDGCDDKIRAAVKDLTLHHGIEALDQSALWTKGELRVESTADPEKLLRRLKKVTGKKVDLLLPKPPQQADKDAAKAAADKDAAAAAAMEALLRRSLLQQQQQAHHQYGGHGQVVLPGAAAWGAALRQQQAAGAVGYDYGGYPWAVQVQQQQQPPEVYPSYGLSAYPAATGGDWGAYAYPPAAAAQGGGPVVYGAGWPY